MPSRLQMKKLKELCKIKTIECDGISESDMEIYEYLKSLGYVKIIYDSEFQRTKDGITLVPTDPLEIHIEELGKDYLENERKRKFEIWIPNIINFIIAVSALLISFVSLSTTAPEVWKNIQTIFAH